MIIFFDYQTTGRKRKLAAVERESPRDDKVHEAIVDKGMEFVGKAIDQQMENIQGTQNNTDALLNQRVIARSN